jgi:hypothetical protein
MYGESSSSIGTTSSTRSLRLVAGQDLLPRETCPSEGSDEFPPNRADLVGRVGTGVGSSLVPLYDDLVRRAMEAEQEAKRIRRDSMRVEALAQILRDALAGKVSIRRCAWCERFDVGGEWLHLDAIGDGQQQIAASLLARATHGICPHCFDREMRTSADRRAARYR